jgi:hypothetical protein
MDMLCTRRRDNLTCGSNDTTLRGEKEAGWCGTGMRNMNGSQINSVKDAAGTSSSFSVVVYSKILEKRHSIRRASKEEKAREI